MPILETARLILRSFREEDVDRMAQLFANPDFMRFSLGVFTERKQTIAFVEKVIGWDRAGTPSQFAVVRAQRGRDYRLLRFLLSSGACHRRHRDRLSTASRLLEPRPHY